MPALRPALRHRSAICGLLLLILPASARAQQRNPVALPPMMLAHHNCDPELAILARGVDYGALTALVAAISPHVGVMARVDGTVRASLLMPMSVPIGPAWPTRTLLGWHECTREEEAFRPFRLSLEPGLFLHEHPTGFVRASFRSIWHPESSFFGLGAGFGAIADWQSGGAVGFSSELLLQLGGCCAPPFWQLSVRRDQYPSDRDREAFVFVFGPTVW